MNMIPEVDHTTNFQPQTISDLGTFSRWDDPNPSTLQASDQLVFSPLSAQEFLTNSPQVVPTTTESLPGSHSTFPAYPYVLNRDAAALAPITDSAMLYPSNSLPETFPMPPDSSNMQQLDNTNFQPASTQNGMTLPSPPEGVSAAQWFAWLHQS